MGSTDTFTEQAEHLVLREGCGMVDRSERGKLALTGEEAVEFLNGQVTNELAVLQPGEGCYAAFLTHKGMMLGDLRILAVGTDPDGPPTELLLDTERVALQALFDLVRRYSIGYEVQLHKRTLESSMISLIGPRSGAVAAGATGLGQASLPASEHSHVAVLLGGAEARLVRTDDGFEVLCAATDRDGAWRVLEGEGARAVSERAVEVLRVERGRPRYGLDIDERTIPQEAGLNERAVSFTKGCYVGQETVARLHYRGKPNRHLRGLRLSAPAVTGEELRLGERPVGRLGSVVYSPELGSIALALVRREAALGDTLTVGERGVSAVVSELPFSR